MGSIIEQTSFLNGANATFVAEIYAKFLENPDSVDPSWRDFFATLHDDVRGLLDEMRGASWAPRSTSVIGNGGNGGGNGHAAAQGAPLSYSAAAVPQAAPDEIRQATLDSIRALILIRSYRVRGHLESSLDPLGLVKPESHPELDPATYGFTDADLDRPIFINYLLGFEAATMRQILKALRDTYCRSIGTEYMHIQGPEEKAWIQERIEGAHNRTDFTAPGKKAILAALTRSEVFEQFLDKRYTGAKRFGLEGGETLIPALEQIVKRGGQLGMREVYGQAVPRHVLGIRGQLTEP